MAYKSIKPEVIQERIIRLKSELRRLQVELRLSEAERRDRERLQHVSQQIVRKGPPEPPL